MCEKENSNCNDNCQRKEPENVTIPEKKQRKEEQKKKNNFKHLCFVH